MPITNYEMKNIQKQNNSEGGAKIIVLVIVAILILLSAAQIFLAARVATTGEEITRLQTQRDELVLKNKRLGAEINGISTLSYIEQKAREDLGMIDATGNVAYLDMLATESYASR